MSLHELDLAQKISDQVICVHGSAIERYGEPEDIFTSEYIKKLYGVTKGSYNADFGCLELEPPAGHTGGVCNSRERKWYSSLSQAAEKGHSFLQQECSMRMMWTARWQRHWRQRLSLKKHFVRSVQRRMKKQERS